MKKLLSVFLAIVVLTGSGNIFLAQAQAASDLKINRLVAYYFHGSFRCATCHKLEQYIKEAIETNFKDELASGILELKIINLEDKGNEHYAKDYQLYTKSLILSLIKDGQETEWINLDKIWEYAGNKPRFIDYVKSGVTNLLKELP